MWSFGHSICEIERSHHRVVIEETPTTGGIWLFGGFALLTLSLWVTKLSLSRSTLAREAVGAFSGLFFALLALYASVRSTYTADRSSGQLIIERRILCWTVRTVYDAHTIDRVYVRDTNKGTGLYVRLKSQRNKRLSWSLDFIPLEAFAESLNTALNTHHQP
jgi:UDP-N-acetylmuramyl pentapeptide phosphotransferase/UDP-N-acetylglucosamine-1-phosphate transferase